jgi:hypothetical protein
MLLAEATRAGERLIDTTGALTGCAMPGPGRGCGRGDMRGECIRMTDPLTIRLDGRSRGLGDLCLEDSRSSGDCVLGYTI